MRYTAANDGRKQRPRPAGTARARDGEGEASQPQGGAAGGVQDGLREELAVRRGRGRRQRGPRRLRAHRLRTPGHVEPHSQAQGTNVLRGEEGV